MKRVVLVTKENRPAGRTVIAANRKGRIVYQREQPDALARGKRRTE